MTEHVLTFDASSHSADAIQRAAYRLSDRLSCDLISDESVYRCKLHLKESDVSDEETLADFRNEVLDQTLRERIREETEPMRTLILAQAFSRTGLVEPRDG